MSSKRTTGIELLSALRRAGSTMILSEIPESYFSEGEERNAFLWLKEYVKEYSAFPSPLTVREEVDIQTIATKEPVEYYIEKARKRALYTAMVQQVDALQESLQDMNPDEAINIARQMVSTSNLLSRRQSGIVTAEQAVQELLLDYQAAKENRGLRGITTGCPWLDLKTGGWQSSDLISIVGRPSRGKTYVMLKYAHAAWMARKSVLFVSMEMSALQLMRRWVGIHSGINPDFIRKGAISSRNESYVLSSMDSIVQHGVPLNIVVGNFRKSVDMIRSLCDEYVPDIVFVDASYLLQPEKKRQGNSGRREVVSDVIEELKMLGTYIDRPIIQSVQFNRQAERIVKKTEKEEKEEAKNPIAHLNLSKIGETDVIGQASSIVIGLEKSLPPNENTRRVLGFLKGREGEMGWWEMNYKFNPVNFSTIITKQMSDEPDQDYDESDMGDDSQNLEWVA